MTCSEGLEARLLEALEGHRWLPLEVLEANGTRRTRLLNRAKARELARPMGSGFRSLESG
jgi:hypothetical protein